MGDLVKWLPEETHVREFVSPNPRTGFYLDGSVFTYACFKMDWCLKRPKMNGKEVRDGPTKE